MSKLAELNLQKQHRQELKESTKALMAKHALKFVHIPGPGNKGGITVAYQKPLFANDQVFRFTTAIVSPLDTYDRLMGRSVCCEAFALGHWTYLKRPKNTSIHNFLKNMLEYHFGLYSEYQ